MNKTLARVLLLLLGAYSGWLIATQGIMTLLPVITDAGWGTQVMADLLCALTMSATLLYKDAKRRGANPWPWIVAGFLFGSPAPLAYFAIYGDAGAERS